MPPTVTVHAVDNLVSAGGERRGKKPTGGYIRTDPTPWFQIGCREEELGNSPQCE
jgi:hypothetical protein